MPRLAPRASIATSGPGCGGTRPCMPRGRRGRGCRPASAAAASGVRRAGSPASAGRGRSRRTSAGRSARRRGPSPRAAPARRPRPMIVSTIWSAPPESASSLPNMAPSAIRMPTPATVRAEAVRRSWRGRRPSARRRRRRRVSAPSVSARKGCSLKRGDQDDDHGDAEQRGQHELTGPGGRASTGSVPRREQDGVHRVSSGRDRGDCAGNWVTSSSTSSSTGRSRSATTPSSSARSGSRSSS